MSSDGLVVGNWRFAVLARPELYSAHHFLASRCVSNL